MTDETNVTVRVHSAEDVQKYKDAFASTVRIRVHKESGEQLSYEETVALREELAEFPSVSLEQLRAFLSA